MKLNRFVKTLFIFFVFFSLTSCSNSEIIPVSDSSATINLWTYPVGGFGNLEELKSIIAIFNVYHPEIEVNVKILDYQTGDKVVEDAISSGNPPDIIFEGPERIVANWGARGYLIELSDLYTKQASDIYNHVIEACTSPNGNIYEYPLAMVTHCMAINKRIFEEADALKYINLSKYTWTTEDFYKAVHSLYKKTKKDVLYMYCASQSGDQGTRALVNNLYDGRFTNIEHTEYTISSEKNIRALFYLLDLKGLKLRPDLNSSEEIDLFRAGKLPISICWNPILHNTPNSSGLLGRTDNGDEIIPLHFPSPSGLSKLSSGIWGFGIFDNVDENKIAASKTFVSFISNFESVVDKAVKITGGLPVHKNLVDVYTSTPSEESMKLFQNKFMPSMGDYYQITPGWNEVRKRWYKALRDIANGKDIRNTLIECNNYANEIAAEEEKNN